MYCLYAKLLEISTEFYSDLVSQNNPCESVDTYKIFCTFHGIRDIWSPVGVCKNGIVCFGYLGPEKYQHSLRLQNPSSGIWIWDFPEIPFSPQLHYFLESLMSQELHVLATSCSTSRQADNFVMKRLARKIYPIQTLSITLEPNSWWDPFDSPWQCSEPVCQLNTIWTELLFPFVFQMSMARGASLLATDS